MPDPRIAIVDYGMGNLASVGKACEKCGGRPVLSSRTRELDKSGGLILPGVGAFAAAMKNLNDRGLVGFLKDYIKSGRPFLGICLGMQLLFEGSEEAGARKGLGVLPGRAVRFRGRGLKIPHMGWNSVRLVRRNPLVKGVRDASYFYFVHSYYIRPGRGEHVTGLTGYGRVRFASAAASGRVFAFQFHPEKSQASGLVIYRNFIGMCG